MVASGCESGTADAVIIGGGIGGLVCAAYLAVSGLRVLVAEQHNVVGGNSQVFRRRGKYEFDVGVHYLGDCGPDGIIPAILSGLGAAGRVTFRPMDNDGFDRLLLPGFTVDVPAGWDRYLGRLTAALPAEAAGLTRCVNVLAAVAAVIRSRLVTGSAGLPAGVDLDAVRSGDGTLAALFTECGLSRRAGALLAAQSGNYGTPPSATPVTVHAAMLDHYLRGAYYPAGGGQMLPATLTEVIQAHGGVVRTRCRVRRILVSGGHAEGVELADGTTVRAPVVVSNADYRQTILELCDKDAFPDAVRERTRQAAMRAAVATVYVVVDRPIDVPNANLWWWREADIEDSYIAALSGAGPLPFAFLSFASVKDRGNPATCPPGHANFQVMTLIPPLTSVSPEYRREAGYQSAKQRMSDELVDIAEQLIGPFRSRITHLETATAHTNHRFTLGGCGTPYGLAEWGGVSRRPDVRTSVDGLYVVGKSTRYGSGIAATAIGGVTAASRILGRPLLPSVHAGTVLGDPGMLRDRDTAFDPLQTSRGQYRRG